MTPAEKINEVLKIKGLKPGKAAGMIGVSPSTLSKALKRGKGVHETTIAKFIGHFRVRPEWWDTEKGEMFEQKLTTVRKEESTEDKTTDAYKHLLAEILAENQRLKVELAVLRGQQKT